MTATKSQFDKQEQVCVNCRHYRRAWTLKGLISRFFDNGRDYHLCALAGSNKDIDPVTGRVTVTQNLRNCRWMLTEHCLWGSRWEPSEQFVRRKKYLFKVIATNNKE